MKLFYFFLPLYLTGCSAISLLNSGSINMKYKLSKAKFFGVTYDEKSRLSNPSISVRNLQHPKLYKKWDFNLALTPSIHYDDTTYGTGATFFDERSSKLETYRDINVKRMIGLGNIKSTFHTPIGAFSLSVGFGGTLYKLDDGQDLETIKTREIRKVDLGYYAFVSKHFFLLFGPRYYKAGYESYVFALRFGYFWGKS